MMTRKQAIEGLKDFYQCDFFAEYIYDRLDDIITCLKAEDELGFDIWGVKDLDCDIFELLCDPEEADDEVKAKLIAKYHRYNRWSGEVLKRW